MSELEKKKNTAHKGGKVSIVGAGMVGASLAYTLVVRGLANEIVLVDVNRDRAKGEAMDLSHALPFNVQTMVYDGDYADCAGSDIVVITAGAAQKAGESRLSLVDKNVEVYRSIVPKVVNVAATAIILIVSNPVDVLTFVTLRLSGLPTRQVLGSGTVLDTARIRYELGARCHIDPRSIHAYIIGEHGDTEVPLWSLANIAGVRLRDYCRLCGRGCTDTDLEKVFERVRDAAYEIIRLKGATYFAIASGAARMIQAILRDQNTVFTASTLLTGQYGIRDVCLSLPLVLHRQGVKEVIEVPVSEQERDMLKKSARVIRDKIDRLSL